MVFSFYEMQKMERQGERALRERYRLQRYLAHGRFEDVNHTSREMSRLVKLARTFAETGQPILVYGEVGSGKSLFAQSIHNASPCSKGPFVTFDCAAHSLSRKPPCPGRARRRTPERSIWTTWTSSRPAGSGCSAVCSARAWCMCRARTPPTPVAARVIGSLTGDLAPKLEAGVFQPELYYLLTPPAAEPAAPAHPPGRSEPGHRHVPGRLRGEVQPLCGAHQGGPAAAHGLPLAGQLYPAPRLSGAHGAHRPRPHGKRRLCALPCWRSSIPSRWSAPRGRPSPAAVSPEAARLAEVLSRNGGSRAAAAAELGISKTTLWRRMKQYGIRDRFEG